MSIQIIATGKICQEFKTGEYKNKQGETKKYLLMNLVTGKDQFLSVFCHGSNGQYLSGNGSVGDYVQVVGSLKTEVYKDTVNLSCTASVVHLINPIKFREEQPKRDLNKQLYKEPEPFSDEIPF